MGNSLLQTVMTSHCSRQVESPEFDTPGRVSSIEIRASEKLHRKVMITISTAP